MIVMSRYIEIPKEELLGEGMQVMFCIQCSEGSRRSLMARSASAAAGGTPLSAHPVQTGKLSARPVHRGPVSLLIGSRAFSSKRRRLRPRSSTPS